MVASRGARMDDPAYNTKRVQWLHVDTHKPRSATYRACCQDYCGRPGRV